MIPPLWGAAAAASVVYLWMVGRGRKNALKVVPALLLAWATVGIDPWFGVAYAACALGDGFLLDKERFFLLGLVAFLVGHIAFVVAFLRAPGLVDATMPQLVLILGAALGMLAVLLPAVRSTLLKVAIPVYATALAAMGITAARYSPLAGAGAFFFLVSDAALAVNRFRRPFRGAEPFVMTLYYMALLTLGTAILTRAP